MSSWSARGNVLLFVDSTQSDMPSFSMFRKIMPMNPFKSGIFQSRIASRVRKGDLDIEWNENCPAGDE
jgi:hypothetical protein